jgi:hypothetical protein
MLSMNIRLNRIGNWTSAKSLNYLGNVTHILSVNHVSSALHYRNETSDFYESKTPFTISQTSLEQIARHFLKKNYVLESKNIDLKLDKISYLHQRNESPKLNKYDEKILQGIVIFYRDINGIPVLGPGGYVIVSVVSDESIVSCRRLMRQVGERISEHKVIDTKHVIDQFEKRLISYGFDGLISVLDIKFCYFEAGKNDKQEFFEPSYIILFSMSTGEKNFFYKSIEVIPGIENPKQMWPLEKRFPVP